MGFFDFMQKVNLAGSGDPNKQIFAGLNALGLQVTRQEATGVTELAGTYQGRQSGMFIDASSLMATAGKAYALQAGTAIAGAAGLISQSMQDYRTRMHTRRAAWGMQSAAVHIGFTIVGSGSATGPVEIGRSAAAGSPIGPGLFASGDPALVGKLSHPNLVPQLQSAFFEQIEVTGPNVHASWSGPNSEYQKIVLQLAQVAQSTLNALSGVAYLVCEGGS